nr:ribonuclease H-like domain-containing protein [Tanacetum cinerariifolium]
MKRKKDVDSMSLEELIAWEQEEAQSPSYLRLPHVRQRTLVIHGKGKVLLDDFKAVGNDLCSKDGLILTTGDGEPVVRGSSFSMRMQQHLTFTDHALWEVIVNGDLVSPVASASVEGPISPKTAEQKLARKNELKAKSTLMLAIPDEHLLKFHAYKDAKSLWEAIKNRFGGNKESKKIQKTILKQNYENFDSSSQEGLDKTYYSLPSAWNNIALIMRNKSDLDTLSMDDLYNNLKIDTNDLEVMNLKWQVAMLTMRVNRTNVECYNYHMRGHFARECKAPRNRGNGNKDAPTRNAPVDTSTTNALVVQDGIDKTGLGYDGQMNESDLNEIHVNESEVLNNVVDNCESDGDDNQVNDRADLSFAGLDNSVFKSKVSETITSVPKIETDVSKTSKDSLEKPKIVRSSAPIIEEWESDSEDENLENALKDKDDLKLKLEKFETSSKNLTKLINRQISSIDKTGLGYDGQMNESDLNEIHVNESEVLNNVVDNCESDGDDNQVNDRADLSFAGLDNSVFKSKVSETITSVPKIETDVSKTSKDSLEKPKIVRSSAPIIEEWESDSEDENVAAASVSVARHVNTATSRPSVNNETYSYFKAYSPVRRPFNQNSTAKTNNFNEKVNIAKVNNGITAGPKVVVSASEGNRSNGNPQYALHDQGIFNSRCSRHMTGNKSYLADYQEIDGGFVAFRGNAKVGKITGKGKIRTGKLDFKDVYFVKELKFNLFSVLQICDKKNSVLFTDTECVVLSLDFKRLDESQFLLKRLDESQFLLKVPRNNNNMYSFDSKNVVPVGGLTCLFAKATLDESSLWHRRLGHINFKTMNKLMRENLVRDLPSKLFENDQTCVACQNRKQHKASCKFDGKFDDGFFIGYSINSKAFRVFNTRTKIVKENLYIDFLENKPNVARTGPNWMFDIDTLTMSMNYQPVFAENQTNDNAGTKTNINAARKKSVPGPHYVLQPLLTSNSQGPKNSEDEVANDARKKSTKVPRKENEVQDPAKERKVANTNNTNRLNTVSSSFTTVDPGRERSQRNEFKSMFGQDKDSNGNRMFTPISVAGSTYVYLGGLIPVNVATLSNADLPTDPIMPDLEDTANL